MPVYAADGDQRSVIGDGSSEPSTSDGLKLRLVYAGPESPSLNKDNEGEPSIVVAAGRAFDIRWFVDNEADGPQRLLLHEVNGSGILPAVPPRVWTTVERRDGEGRWRPIPRSERFICAFGLARTYARVRELASGETVELHTPRPGQVASGRGLQAPGQIRVIGHYEVARAWLTDLAATGGASVSDDEDLVVHLVSEPLYLTVVRPLEINMRVRRARAKRGEDRLSRRISIELENTSSETQIVQKPTSSSLFITLQSDSIGGEEVLSPINPIYPNDVAPSFLELKPGQRLELVSATNDYSTPIAWDGSRAGLETTKIRVDYRPDLERGAQLRTGWMPLAAKRTR